jgi:hypothetical protein
MLWWGYNKDYRDLWMPPEACAGRGRALRALASRAAYGSGAILDVFCGIRQPETVNGIAQRPIEGASMAYTFDKAGADVRLLEQEGRQ